MRSPTRATGKGSALRARAVASIWARASAGVIASMAAIRPWPSRPGPGRSADARLASVPLGRSMRIVRAEVSASEAKQSRWAERAGARSLRRIAPRDESGEGRRELRPRGGGDGRFRRFRVQFAQPRHHFTAEEGDVGDRVGVIEKTALAEKQ